MDMIKSMTYICYFIMHNRIISSFLLCTIFDLTEHEIFLN